MTLRPTYANVASTVALFVALGGTAIAASGGSSSPEPAVPAQVTAANTINACTAKKGAKKGLLRVAKVCKKSETKVSWNITGPQGPQGPQGATGSAGTAGAPGANGSAGPGGTSAFVPVGAVAYFDLAACPEGWAAFGPAAGRYVVGTPAGGANGAQVGTALADGENRPVGRHTHALTDPGHAHAAAAGNTIVAGNVPFVRFQSNGSAAAGSAGTLTTASATTGISVQQAGAVDGTNAPYVQLLACKKG